MVSSDCENTGITRFEVSMLLEFIPYPIFLLSVIYFELTITRIRIVPLFPPYLLRNLTPQLYRGRSKNVPNGVTQEQRDCLAH